MSKATPVVIPHENVNDQSVRLISWLVTNGQKVERDQPLAQLEGSKTTFEVYAPVAGFARLAHAEGVEIDVGALLCGIESEEPAEVLQPSPQLSSPAGAVAAPAVPAPPVNGTKTPEPALESPDSSIESDDAPRETRLSKEALKLCQRRGLDPQVFAGRGLVTASDVLHELGETPSRTPSTASPSGNHHPPPLPTEKPTAAQGVPFRSEELARAKRTEVKYLQSARRATLPSVVSVAIPTRGLRGAVAQHPTIQGTATAVILFETARLLRKYPLFNAFYSEGAANVYEDVNVGFAIDADRGLKVPVLRDADRKSFPQIVAEMQELLVQYLNDEIPLPALAGGTFTITDLSGEGVFSFLPLLNQGQSAILGVGAEFFPPGSKEGMFNLILAFDHQLSEGRQAARFLNDLSQRLQSYESALAPTSGNAPGGGELYCSECLRPIAELRKLDAHLLSTVNPDRSQGLICSFCLAGWN